MEGEVQTIAMDLSAILSAVQRFLQTLILPSRLTQVAVAVGCLIVALVLRRVLNPSINAWMHSLTGRPKWQLRWLVILNRQLTLIMFTGLVWASAGIVSQIYVFPSRRYLLVLIATIATAWLAIRFASYLIRNGFLRRILVWGFSTYALLYYLGFLDETTAFLDGLGIEFGSFRLTVLAILKALIVTGILLAIARLLSKTSAERLRRNDELSPSVRELAVKVIQVLLYTAAFFIGLKAVGFDLTGLAVLSGAIGVGLGFGLQKVVSNLVSGVIILLDKSIKPGDVISLGDTFGWINDLSARYVSVVTRDGREYLIPNGDLITGQVVNWSHSSDYVRLDIFFGTAYHDDPHEVRRIAIEAAMSVERVLEKPKTPVCHIVGFGDSSVDYILRFWIEDPTGGLTNIRGAVYLALWDAFQENGISIPFPQREVKMLEGSQVRHRALD